MYKKISTKNICRDIDNETEQQQLIKTISENKDFPYSCLLGRQEQVKTVQQLRFFHKIIDEYLIALKQIEPEIYSETTSRDLIEDIKLKCGYYNKSPVSCLPIEIKKKLFKIIKINFPADVNLITEAFKSITFKSLAEATKTELSAMIKELFKYILFNQDLTFIKNVFKYNEALCQIMYSYFAENINKDVADEDSARIISILTSIFDELRKEGIVLC